eukprot:16438358-Heterocapsa_arctica.AAC.1
MSDVTPNKYINATFIAHASRSHCHEMPNQGPGRKAYRMRLALADDMRCALCQFRDTLTELLSK